MTTTAQGAPAPAAFRFTPATDQSAVAHLNITVNAVRHMPDGWLRLSVRCGDIGFGIAIPPAQGRPDFQTGDRLRLEYPKGDNPLKTCFSALYLECLKPQPARNHSMNELVKIEAREISGAAVQTCNARDLWEFVESKQDFSDWITNRIAKYGFSEGEDFSINLWKTPEGGRPRKDYHLTIEMGKELAMVENNDKGRHVRRYFIECERRAKAAPAIDPMQVLADPAAMRGLLLTYTEKVLTLESKVGELAPKAEALNRIADAEGSMNCTLAAKTLQVPPKKLFEYLRENHWIYRRPGGSGNVAYQDKIHAGYLTHKVTTVQREDGTDKVVEQVLVTGKGLAKLSQAFACQ